MEPNKGGRPRKELENIHFDGWAQLDALIVWTNAEHCAEVLGMDTETLSARIKEKYGLSFPQYKDKKKEPLRISLRQKQFEVAMAGNVPMLIWLGKNELNQTEKNENSMQNGVISLTISEEENKL